MRDVRRGSIVQLLSGGPKMTVDSFEKKLEGPSLMKAKRVDDESLVICKWFEDGKLKTGTFSAESLIIVDQQDL
ncbi:DUF2158 domain-containing protein [Fibrella aquatilis]|uniref:DUF2158 domain-containing protein n=1 Tax=Fibrella aquatilis TaxID=2817059 RepID=A0A939JYM4_9BACT|nr:DUF2158 domain-containing protein [Fibrella aquatilis]MBO0932259.1 DUF2158 domain-containing protein [Fibrella aquatilis]